MKFFLCLCWGMLGSCIYDHQDTDFTLYSVNPEFSISIQLADGKNISSLVATDFDNYYYSVGNKLFIFDTGLEKSAEVPSEIYSGKNHALKVLRIS